MLRPLQAGCRSPRHAVAPRTSLPCPPPASSDSHTHGFSADSVTHTSGNCHRAGMETSCCYKLCCIWQAWDRWGTFAGPMVSAWSQVGAGPPSAPHRGLLSPHCLSKGLPKRSDMSIDASMGWSQPCDCNLGRMVAGRGVSVGQHPSCCCCVEALLVLRQATCTHT